MMDEGITLERDFSFQGKKIQYPSFRKRGGETYEEEHDFLLSLLELQTWSFLDTISQPSVFSGAK